MLTITRIIQYTRTPTPTGKKDRRSREEKLKEYRARWREKRKAEGKCTCGGDRVPGKDACQKCLIGRRRQSDADATAARRAMAIEEGYCGMCACRKPTPPKRTCDTCLEKSRESYRKRNAR